MKNKVNRRKQSVSTKQLLVQARRKEIEVHVDGPYGSPSTRIFFVTHAVLVGAGIGVTPFASILQSVMMSWQNGLPKANVDIDYYNGSSTIATQSFVGMVADTGLFTSNGINYLVVMLQYMKGELNETDTKERTIIFVLKLDSAGKKVAKTWSRELRLKAISVNGHSLDYITWEFLLDGVDQNVQESWRANYMEVDVFTTLGSPIAGTISGVLTSGRFSAT
ncbi:uncharacterized protein [Panulirus ornatus]|uniref:uncharacterized protein isoform X2 n=1 Tax=Panulirus ornatus TaxID=150431 RepID=UPI003A886F7A